MRRTTRAMSDRHEADIAEALGGRINKGSGNQWANPIDGRNEHYDEGINFAWDCKSTLAQSITITREMWGKAREQSIGEVPLLPLRFYDSERLAVGLDLVAISLDDFLELVERVNGQ